MSNNNNLGETLLPKYWYCPVTHVNGTISVIDTCNVLSNYGNESSSYVHQILPLAGEHIVRTYCLASELEPSKWRDLQVAALRGEVFGYARQEIIPKLIDFCKELDSN